MLASSVQSPALIVSVPGKELNAPNPMEVNFGIFPSVNNDSKLAFGEENAHEPILTSSGRSPSARVNFRRRFDTPIWLNASSPIEVSAGIGPRVIPEGWL